jgi:hypothetical protein
MSGRIKNVFFLYCTIMYKTMGHTEQYFVKLYVLFTIFPMNGWGGRAALYQEFLKFF